MVSASRLIACVLLAAPFQEEKLPRVVEGFAIDLVAEHPTVRWPSAVHCLDDGSLLVAEDPMDMPGPTDQPLDRILRLQFQSDGSFTTSVFAEKLYAVFGIQQIDDSVYVMNMPFLTVLRDRDGDGVAEERRELLDDLGPPAPGHPGGFNDHIVSGIRLAMDGFLYVSVGDKGIPLAHGTDGSTVSLRGGGVVRLRPDGSRLELVASGTRNHLEVLMDERDEMFTYDNTDDGLGWWTRVTHIVHGGYYGYPWDYHDHPERMLPPMTDYGGGSPCGATAYREGLWPAPYDTGAYWCEWAKSSVRRFDFERRGASFAVAAVEDFVVAGDVQDFRPLKICESPDGRFLYLSDWNHPGWTAPVEAGRLWRIRRADDDPERLSPPRTLPEEVEGLVAALDHPSFRLRLRAQRELARRGDAARPALAREVRAPSSERSERHALWAAAALGERALLVEAARSGRAPAVETALRALADLGSAGGFAAEILRHSSDAFVQRAAAHALATSSGRDIDALCAVLGSSDDDFLRFAIRRALQRPLVMAQVAERVRSSPNSLREQLELVLFEQYDLGAQRVLAGIAGDSRASLAARRSALESVADNARRREPWDGKWWSIDPARRPPPPRTVDWEGTPLARSAIAGALQDAGRELRRAAIAAAGSANDPALCESLVARYWKESDTGLQKDILGVIGSLAGPGAVRFLARVLRDPRVEPSLASAAIEAAVRIGSREMASTLAEVAADERLAAADLVRVLAALGRLEHVDAAATIEARLAHSDAGVRRAACDALARVSGADAAMALERMLVDRDALVRASAIEALGDLARPESVPALLAQVSDPTNSSAATRALCATPDHRALSAYLGGLESGDLGLRTACRQALSSIRETVRGELEGRATRGELPAEALLELRRVYSEPQPIQSWHLIGPFPRADEAWRLERDALDLARTFELDDGPRAWIEHPADPANGFVDLERALASRSEVAAYAHAILASSREREADVLVGSDDMLTLWVNGEQVFDFSGQRAWSADQDRFPVRLRAGENALLARIGQAGGQWSFNVKVSGEGEGPLFAGEAPPRDAAGHRAAALAGGGDVERGRRWIGDPAASMCLRCHVVEGAGLAVGPDLSDVGAKYDRAELVRSLLEPSQRVGEAYRVQVLVTHDERLFTGLVRGEADGVITLVDSNGDVQQVSLADVAERRASEVSLMPDGQALLLDRADFVDLVAYLESLAGPARGSE